MLQQIINTMNEFIRIRVSSEDKEYQKKIKKYCKTLLLKTECH